MSTFGDVLPITPAYMLVGANCLAVSAEGLSVSILTRHAVVFFHHPIMYVCNNISFDPTPCRNVAVQNDTVLVSVVQLTVGVRPGGHVS